MTTNHTKGLTNAQRAVYRRAAEESQRTGRMQGFPALNWPEYTGGSVQVAADHLLELLSDESQLTSGSTP